MRVRMSGAETVCLALLGVGCYLATRLKVQAQPKQKTFPLSVTQVDRLLDAVSDINIQQRMVYKMRWVKSGLMQEE